jgi:hypothetical protein
MPVSIDHLATTPRPIVVTGTVTATPGAAPATGTVTESAASVTTTSTTVVAANSSRVGGYVQNVSDTDMYVSWGGTAATNKSYLAPGSSLPFIITGYCYKGALTALHTASSGTKTLAIVQLT